MLREPLAKAADAVASAIRESQEYEEYERQKKAVRSDPATKALIERAKQIQISLMEIPEGERGSDYAESLQDEYEEITENTSVYEYARAESAYLMMVQEVLGSIIENVDIDIQ